MSKGFVYFFKHNNVAGVKIGRTSGESVINRFSAFKTYSPFGSEILGFYECNDCVAEEKNLHNRYAAQRLSGEFFNISTDEVALLVGNNNKTLHKAVMLVNEFLADENNDILKLISFLKNANKNAVSLDNPISIESIEIKKNIVKDNDGFLTTTMIKDIIEKNTNEKVNIKKLGMALKRMGYVRTQKKNIGFGYRANRQ